jgi:hypothetical protein
MNQLARYIATIPTTLNLTNDFKVLILNIPLELLDLLDLLDLRVFLLRTDFAILYFIVDFNLIYYLFKRILLDRRFATATNYRITHLNKWILYII